MESIDLRHPLAAAFLLLLVTVPSTAQTTAPPSPTPEEALTRAGAAWTAAYNADDLEALVAVYSDDAEALPPSSPPVRGAEAIRSLFQELRDSGLVHFDVRQREVGTEGDLGYREVFWTAHDSRGRVLDRGKAVEVWKRVDGRWRLHKDMWSSNQPSAMPAPTRGGHVD